MRETKDNEERRNEFIDAAEKLFKENGVMDTTINAIVKEMDVAKGLFYYYFKSKDDVIDAISEKYNREFKQAVKQAMNTEQDYDERMDEFLNETINTFRNMWENFHGENDTIDLTILSSKSMDEAKNTANETLRQLLEEGNELGKLYVKNVAYFADMIIGGMAEMISHPEIDLDEIKKMIDRLIEQAGKDEK